jgi:hypothetical protein
MENDKYVLGFNHGYILLDKKPELLGFISKTNSKSDYIQGLKDGSFQFYLEAHKDIMKKAEIKKAVKHDEEEIKRK